MNLLERKKYANGDAVHDALFTYSHSFRFFWKDGSRRSRLSHLMQFSFAVIIYNSLIKASEN